MKRKELLDSLFASFSNNEPGFNVKIAVRGKEIYSKTVGLADLENNVGISEATIFEAGSISKSVTAAAVLVLCEKFGVKLSDDIRKYYPEMPSYGSVLTIQHMLNHTSGLKDWGHVAAVSGVPRHSYTYSQKAALKIIFNQPTLNFQSGSEYLYSNSNYTLLASLVEKVSKMSYQQFTQTELFAPLGMMHTSWRTNFKEVVPQRAQAYQSVGKLYQLFMPIEDVFGHGGLLTTVDDLQKWNQRSRSSHSFLKKIFEQQLQTQMLSGNIAMRYANGVFVKTINGIKEISHSGSTAAYNAWSAYYPDQDVSVVILSNNSKLNPEWYGARIKELLFPNERKSDQRHAKNVFVPSKKMIEEKDGLFKNVTGVDYLDLGHDDSTLFFTINKSRFVFTSDQQIEMGDLKIKFLSNNEFELSRSSNVSDKVYRYRRVERVDRNALKNSLEDYIGSFESTDANVLYQLKIISGSLVAQYGIGVSQMFFYPIAKDVFVIGTILVEFKRDANQQISGFEVSTDRAFRIWFSKKK